MAEGPLRRDSKSGRDYGSDQRANDYADARAAHGDEIVKVVKWAEVVAETVGLPTRISSPLL